MQDVADEAITSGSSPRVGSGPRELPGDLVTVADHEVEDPITEALRAAYPAAVVLGEEAASADPGLADRFATASYASTIDPVGGTNNFVHNPNHAVMRDRASRPTPFSVAGRGVLSCREEGAPSAAKAAGS